jgi:hypothetical protein
VRFPAGEVDPSLLQNIQTFFETRRLLLPGINRTGPEAGLLSLDKAEFKHPWSCTSTSSIYIHGVYREVTLEEHEFLRSPELSPVKCALGIPCPRKCSWRVRMILYVHLLPT